MTTYSHYSLFVEFDSLLAIREINKGYATLCGMGSTIDNILLMAADFLECRFVHAPRQQNSLADALTKIQCIEGTVQLSDSILLVEIRNLDHI